MNHNFFEGKDYKDKKFKSLLPEFYPKEYQEYVKQEEELLILKVKGAKRILEAGVGIGRLIPHLAPLVEEFIGIDTANFMIDASTSAAKKYTNVKIMHGEIEKVGEVFPPNYFDYTLCLWNTLGNVKDPILALKALKTVTSKSILVTVCCKGTMSLRKKFYTAVNVKIVKIDSQEELFYLNGYTSKTFNKADLSHIAKQASLTIKEIKILGTVVLWAELSTVNSTPHTLQPQSS